MALGDCSVEGLLKYNMKVGQICIIDRSLKTPLIHVYLVLRDTRPNSSC